MNRADFVKKLYEIEAVQFGNFVLKSGIVSPFYFNLRTLVSYPQLLKTLSLLIEENLPTTVQFDHFVGVPYAGIPIASLLSAETGTSLLIPRKEEKAYGSKDSIIGKYTSGEKCLLIEDIVTSGESIIETAERLNENGLNVSAAFVIIDRRIVPSDFSAKSGFPLFSLFNLNEVVDILNEAGYITPEQMNSIGKFIQSEKDKTTASSEPVSYNKLTGKLIETMKQKNSRLILSLDVETTAEFFEILDKTAGDIAMLKTHCDILKDFNDDFIKKLQDYAAQYNFLIFEDRKFADIGNTVRMQYRSGMYRISEWADFVTVHLIAGDSIINGLFDGIENKSSFLLARMSAKNNLITEDYTRKVLEAGRKFPQYVSGFIGHGKDRDDIAKFRKKLPAGTLLLMPGVQIDSKGDTIGQTYLSPETAIAGGADGIIVGRGITHAQDVKKAAGLYRVAAPFERVDNER